MSSSSTPSDSSALPGDTAADAQDRPGVAEAFAAGQPHEAVPESEEAAGDDAAAMLLPEAAGGEAGADAAKPVAPAIPDMNPAACAAELRKRFPALFSGAAKPLKLRIQQDIQERAPGVFSKQTLTGFFRRHTRSTPYLMALSKATHRFDLDGQQAGELSEEHRAAATEELTRRRANQDARRAEEQAQHAAAHAAEQARRAETEAEQRQRASLLRDFQATTLTLANFCALKGIAPEALEPMLAQARVEAEERAKNPPPLHRPYVDGRTNPRNDGRGDGRGDGRNDGRGDGRRGNRGGPRSGPNAGAPGGSRPGSNAGGPRNGFPNGRPGDRGPRNAGAPNGGHRNGLVAPKVPDRPIAASNPRSASVEEVTKAIDSEGKSTD